MTNADFRKHAHALVDKMADFLEEIDSYPVKSTLEPKAVLDQLPALAPAAAESMADIIADFDQIIMPGMTHWQHPRFFAYFPANSSYPSLLAEMLTATLGAQCMIWDTSPAAAELEERMMEWLGSMLGLPQTFTGVIQDTASTATLCALLCARERVSHNRINEQGFYGMKQLRVYASSQTHSSIEKGVKIAGFGRENFVAVAVDEQLRLDPNALKAAILKDLANGFLPCCVVSTVGTTGTTAIDPGKAIADICSEFNIWLHIDAAFAGSALILPEYRWMIEGVEQADSFVFNPHKWLFTNFDCTAYFVKDVDALLRTFSILPEYLKTDHQNSVKNYRDWGIPLGRRFRALKLWFVIRSYGIEGLQERLRAHIQMAIDLEEKIASHPDFEIIAPRTLNAIFFALKDEEVDKANSRSEQLMKALNATGKVYFSHTKAHGRYIIRMVIGQTYVQQKDVDLAWQLIQECAKTL